MGACIFSNLVDIHEVLDIFFGLFSLNHSIFFSVILQMYRIHSVRVGLKGQCSMCWRCKQKYNTKNVQKKFVNLDYICEKSYIPLIKKLVTFHDF